MSNYCLDRRTRFDTDRCSITPDDFFTHTFPALAAKNGGLVAAAMDTFSMPPLTVEVEDYCWSVIRKGNSIVAEHGCTDGALTVKLSPPEFSDWAQNQISFNGFLVARSLDYSGGSITDISCWDSAWIALLEGWPVIDDGLSFTDRHGAALDLTTVFTPDDNPQDIAHFLREAGYVHLRGWLNSADMAKISQDMDRALPDYVEGDGKSWWATLADGSRQCVRLQNFVQHSPTTERILRSAMWQHLKTILGGEDKLAQLPVTDNIIEALFKPVGVVSGPSDVSWHRDCHLGRHAYVCSRLTIGIALTPTSADNGTLRVIAGSHRLAMPVEIAKTKPYLPVIAVATETGDLTVHLSCTLHESEPPKVSERRVMYTEIPLAPPEGVSGAIDTSVNVLRDRVNELVRDKD